MKNISRSFFGRIVLNNLSLSLPDYGLYVIEGDNGSGKSTLFYILGLLDSDYQGTFYFQDKNIRRLNSKEKELIRREDISFVFSRGNLISYLSVKENLSLKLKPEQDRVNLIPSLNENEKAWALSGGEEILVSLSREISRQSKLYLLDEVTSNLDEKHLKETMEALDKVSQAHLVVMTTHDQRLKEYGKHLTLSNGKILQ